MDKKSNATAMKSFKSFFRIRPVLIIIAALPAVAFFTVSHQKYGLAGIGEKPASEQAAYPVDGRIADSIRQGSGQGRKIVVYDQGLQMPIGTYTVPEGWRVIQDIATDPYSGNFKKFRLDVVGPQGELVRMFHSVPYLEEKSVEQRWRQTVADSLQSELDQLTIGDFKPSEYMQRSERMKEYARLATDQGNILKYLEATVSGSRNGQAYRGIVRIIDLTSAARPNTGMLTLSFAICPAGQFPQMMQIMEEIDDSYEENPRFEQCLCQIREYLTQLHTRYLYDDFYKDEKTGTMRRWNEAYRMEQYAFPDSCYSRSFPDSLNSYTDEWYVPYDSTASDMSDWHYIDDYKHQ